MSGRIVLGGKTAGSNFNLGTELDPMTADLYDLREAIGTTAYPGATPALSIETSTGKVTIGTTGGSGKFTVVSDSSTVVPCGFYDSRTGATSSTLATILRNGSSVGSISTTATATAFNTSSDARLKTAIVDMPDQGAVIDALQPRQFEFKSQPGVPVRGFIAQELALHVPDAVAAGDDGVDVVQMWGVDYSKLVPILVREIQSLRARVAALGG